MGGQERYEALSQHFARGQAQVMAYIRSLVHDRTAVAWARAVEPSQPLTICVWQGDWSDPQRLPPLARFSLTNSDVVSFHNYGNQGSLQATIRHIRQYGRPLLCTEYVARAFGRTFDPLLANLKEEGVGAYNWGSSPTRPRRTTPLDFWQKKYAGEPRDYWIISKSASSQERSK